MGGLSIPHPGRSGGVGLGGMGGGGLIQQPSMMR